VVLIGKLNNRLEVQRAVLTPDGAGGYTETWETIKYIYAEVSRSSGNRAFQYSQIREGNSYEIVIREPVDYELLPGDRLVYKNKSLAYHSLTDNSIDDYSNVLAFEIA
jgi:head-tail adaptor